MSAQANELKRSIQQFHAEYSASLNRLAGLLDDAGISHYSSGRGAKHITYDIFPASHYIHALLNMVTLDRARKTISSSGFKDFSKGSNYNPATQFLQYLSRWAGFAEELMKHEGDTPRGIAAAQAKLIMNDLLFKLSAAPENKAKKLNTKKTPSASPVDFFTLMKRIGIALQTTEADERTQTAKEFMEQNYKKALAAASERLNLHLAA